MKILANDGISQNGIDVLEAANFEVITEKVDQNQLIDFINENDIKVLLVRSATTARKELIDSCPNLKMIGRGGVGMDNIDVDYTLSAFMKINDYLSTTLIMQCIYDDNAIKKIQLREVFGLAFVIDILEIIDIMKLFENWGSNFFGRCYPSPF